MNIFCGNCGKDSGVVREVSDGVNAFNVQKVGFIAKLPVIIGIPEWLLTCSFECKSELFLKKCTEYNVSEEQVAQAKREIQVMKDKLPQMAKETCEFMGKLQTVLKKQEKPIQKQ